MAIARVQRCNAVKAAAGTTVAATFLSPPDSASVLLAIVNWANGTGATSVASTGRTWTKDKEKIYTSDGTTVIGTVQLWRGVGGTDDTITATGAAVTAEISVYEYSGLGTGAPEVTASTFGYNDGGENVAGEGSPATGTTATNSTANSLAFGGSGNRVFQASSTTDAGGEATKVEDVSGSGNTYGLTIFEGIETSTAAMNGAANWSVGPATFGLGGVIGVYAIASAASGAPSRTLTGVGI